MRIAVISPHADDAVWSVGEHMLSRPDDQFTIICPLMGIPEEPEGRRVKHTTILSEHAEACRRGGWERIDGPFFDDAVECDIGDSSWSPNLGRWIARQLKDWNGDHAFVDRFDEWWVPVGIHHPDHTQVAGATVGIGRRTARLLRYEELPYRVLYPRDAPLMGLGDRLEGFGPLGPQLEAKRRLANVYASQIGPEDERCIYAPERLWRRA